MKYTKLSPGGLRFELGEIESRQEEYPYTLAFLELMDRLLQTVIPSDLGREVR